MLIGEPIVVIGAGVAGLALARALALRGAQVTVLEQAEAIREVGAGLQVSPNGLRVLNALGLGESAARLGTEGRSVELVDGTGGGTVARLPLGSGPTAGMFRFFHRADLIELLAAGAREAGVEIRLGVRVAELRPGDRPTAITTSGETIGAFMIAGADGIHSVVREALNGRTAPFFTHQVAWRAVIPSEAPVPPVARVFMGPGRHVVTYPLRGGRLRNIVAVEERRRWAEESWSLTDDALALRVAFEDFVPEVRGWLDRIEAPNLWGLFRHEVASRWWGPGLAILGDAAHPMLPFLAQGANMALEDAWVLADCLSADPDRDAALASYQARRQSRARQVVDAANANARNYHLSGIRREVGHLGLRILSRLAPNALLGRFDWLYGHDVTAAG
ncbi:MAG: FAD-dependent oxidoreductase [Rhodobacteraceae bacterium]|nr:FAD-dependent oxidoreductase [Paracoccaceae bacterium]